MEIGIPKEIKVHEGRVGIVPSGVRALVAEGHKVIIAVSYTHLTLPTNREV